MQASPQYAIIDFIPSLEQMELVVRIDKRPKRVWLAPEDRELKTHWSDGQLSVIIPKLDIHSVVVIE